MWMVVACYLGLFYREMILIFEMSTEKKTEPDEQSGIHCCTLKYLYPVFISTACGPLRDAVQKFQLLYQHRHYNEGLDDQHLIVSIPKLINAYKNYIL